MKILSNERVFVAGQTGSGKTFLCKHILKDFRRLVVFDAKATLQDWNLSESVDKELDRLQNPKNDVRLRIKTPIGTPEEIYDLTNDYLRRCYTAGEVVIYFDEIFSIATANSYPSFLTACYTRGRELGIGIWTVTQRPFRIPIFAASEADWYFMFRLMQEKDKMRMSEYMGEIVKDVTPKKYEFFVYHTSWNRPRLKILRSEKE